MDIVALAQQYGVPMALVGFFVWQSKIREDRLTTRIESLENYFRDKLVAVVTANTEVMRRMEGYLERSGSGPVNVRADSVFVRRKGDTSHMMDTVDEEGKHR